MDTSCTYTVFTFLHVFSFLEFRLSFATKLSISLVQLFCEFMSCQSCLAFLFSSSFRAAFPYSLLLYSL